MKSKKHIADKYADDVINGKITAGAEVVAACRRYRDDQKREDLELRPHDPDVIIAIMEQTLVHMKGEDDKGRPLLGRPFLLEPWQVFIIYNLFGFWYKGTEERRFKEAFIELGRKNGKTSMIAGIAWAVSILQRRSGSSVYMVAASLEQALQSFDFLKFSLKYTGIADKFHILDNSFHHKIRYEFEGQDGKPDGSIEIIALASNPDKQDSFNCNIVIADEMHTYKNAAQYQVLKDATKAYTNKLVIGISSGGKLAQGFCARRVEYCRKILKLQTEYF